MSSDIKFCMNSDCVNYYEDNCALTYLLEGRSLELVPYDLKTSRSESTKLCKSFKKGVNEGYNQYEREVKRENLIRGELIKRLNSLKVIEYSIRGTEVKYVLVENSLYNLSEIKSILTSIRDRSNELNILSRVYLTYLKNDAPQDEFINILPLGMALGNWWSSIRGFETLK